MVGGVEGGLGLVRAGVAARELRAVVAGDVEEPLLVLLLLTSPLSSPHHNIQHSNTLQTQVKTQIHEYTKVILLIESN